jgi:NAD(P)H dehydrogenase (quinone)
MRARSVALPTCGERQSRRDTLLPLVPGKRGFADNAMAAALAAGVQHIVRSSGAGADASSAVTIAKLQGDIDDKVRTSGIAYTLLRPNNFMQNWVTFAAGQVKSGTTYAPHGDGAISVIDARDIADAAAVVLTNPAAHAGKSHTLTGAEALTDAQMLAAISEAIGCEVRYVDVPEAAAEDGMRGMGMPAEVVAWMMSLNAIIKAGWAAAVSDDLEALTGKSPRRFADFAREHADAWR